MVDRSTIATIAKDQLREFDSLKDSVARSILDEVISYSGAAAFVVKGVRRCGKSTLLKQLLKNRFDEDFAYFNFDDERIAGFTSHDFQLLMEVLIESFGEKKYLLFDEIQNIAGWELFINRLLREGYKVFITGSNANLLSKELGTHLTGRHTDIELFPFSFLEFLKAKKSGPQKSDLYSTIEQVSMLKHFKEYLMNGGMPEVVVLSNETILREVLADIIQRDIVGRYDIRKISEFKSVLNFILANISNEITFSSITKNFNLKSPNTVQKYLFYLEETYLIFTVKRFDRKIKRIDRNPRKIYGIDNGIVTRNATNMSENMGALLENVIAIQLRKKGTPFYYYRGNTGHESDFLVPGEKTAIQVCYELNNTNEMREIRGMEEALKSINGGKGIILTMAQEKEITRHGKKIRIIPVWKWLLESERRKSTQAK
jgi:hypothetical protein